MINALRYEVKVLPLGSFCVVNAQNANEPIFFSTVEAEVRIIAFALNAIASGYSLWWSDDTKGLHGKAYDGPTEGVAPDA
jgi:hypothetical protein